MFCLTRTGQQRRCGRERQQVVRVLPRRRGPRGDAAAVLALREEVHGTSGSTDREVRGYGAGVLRLLARVTVFLFSSQATDFRDSRVCVSPSAAARFEARFCP